MDDSSPQAAEQEATRSRSIRAVLSFVLALGFIFLGFGTLIALVLTKPSPEKTEEIELTTSVRVRALKETTHEVTIATQGVVRSCREVSLAAEVRGKVQSIAPQLVDGGAVEEGQVLVRIDATDFEAALARAESTLADARLALAQEQAQADQAASDWEKLGRGQPSDLVLRVPQIAAAEARIVSARAEVRRARRDLERTEIRAPFDARVREAFVEVGAVVAVGSPVAELYSETDLEVRLPFSLRDFGYLRKDEEAAIELRAEIGGETVIWPAVLDRIESEVERTTLSGYGLATIEPSADGDLPPVGLFVEARVPGRVLERVLELPRSAVRGRNEIWVVRDGRLAKRQVEILRSGREVLIVRGDFEAGDQLVLTRLAAPLVGMKVEVEEVKGVAG
jgi:RND family efflux transporter MFP subunit